MSSQGGTAGFCSPTCSPSLSGSGRIAARPWTGWPRTPVKRAYMAAARRTTRRPWRKPASELLAGMQA